MDKQTIEKAVSSIKDAIASIEAARGNAPNPAEGREAEYFKWLKLGSVVSQLKLVLGFIEEVAK